MTRTPEGGACWSPGLGGTLTMALTGGSGVKPDCVDAARPLHLTVHWEVPRPWAGRLDGEFRVCAFAEGLGEGYAGPLGEAFVRAERGRASYAVKILLPPGTLPGEDGPDLMGLYRITGVLQYRDRHGTLVPGLGVATAPLVRMRRA